MDFAQLFREVLNVEPERHLDLTQIGWERLQVRPPLAPVRPNPNPLLCEEMPAACACGPILNLPWARRAPAARPAAARRRAWGAQRPARGEDGR